MPSPDLDVDAGAFEEWRPLLFASPIACWGVPPTQRTLSRTPPSLAPPQRPCRRIGPRLSRHDRDSASASTSSTRPVPGASPMRSVVARAGGGRGGGRGRAGGLLVVGLSRTPRRAHPAGAGRVPAPRHLGYSFEEVARSLGRSPAACRQLGAGRVNGSRSGDSASTPTCAKGAR